MSRNKVALSSNSNLLIPSNANSPTNIIMSLSTGENFYRLHVFEKIRTLNNRVLYHTTRIKNVLMSNILKIGSFFPRVNCSWILTNSNHPDTSSVPTDVEYFNINDCSEMDDCSDTDESDMTEYTIADTEYDFSEHTIADTDDEFSELEYPPGLDYDDIDRLPRRTYAIAFGEESNEFPNKKPRMNVECGVCLKDFQNNDILLTLTCFHEFHYSCIQPWLETNGSCPTCRFEIILEDD